MNQYVTIFFTALGAIAAVAAGVKGMVYLLSPYSSFKGKLNEVMKRLDKHDQFLDNDKHKLEKLEKGIYDLEDMIHDCLKLNIVMLDHQIDGNGIESMKRLRAEIRDKL